MTKACLITGGSRGIGAATVELLRARGWDVIAPTRAKLDMVNSPSVERYLFNNHFPLLDALVFCHGEWFSKPIDEYSLYNHSICVAQYRSRVISPLNIIMGLLSALSGGCVVTVSSTRGFIGGVETGPYALACAAQIAMMQGYAREYSGVRFNCVCPGLTDTALGQEVIRTGGATPGAPMQPPGVVAAEIVRLIEDGKSNGRVMRVVNSEVSEAKWSW